MTNIMAIITTIEAWVQTIMTIKLPKQRKIDVVAYSLTCSQAP
jgi:hypothetical protein